MYECFLLYRFILWLSVFSIVFSTTIQKENGPLKEFTIQIQGYSPDTNDDYVSVSIRAEPGYIVKFEPFADADRVHHMLLYGCGQPAFNAPFWKGGQTCSGDTHILYAWARNAPSLSLPDDVAFPVGNAEDPVKHLVLQIHYARPFVGRVRDFSGVTLHMSDRRPRYIAEVFLFVGGAPIPPHQPAFLSNMSCTYEGEPELHPFAFRTHTHGMGRVVSAFLNHDNKWTMIGKRNPQWPQLFQKIEKNITIRKKDFISAICRFDSADVDKTTVMGSMGADEMCNFYMMYYREAESTQQVNRVCGWDEKPELMAQYPKEGISLLPPHPEWEHAAHQSGNPFGVEQKLKLTSLGGINFGQIAGLAITKDGDIAVFHRASRVWDGAAFDGNNVMQDKTPIPEATILVGTPVDGDLTLKTKYGEGLFYMPHGIFIDDDGYIYTTDVGSHQVIKWKVKNGKLEQVWALGEKLVPGSDQTHFCKPAGVAASKHDGSVYIADGYCNNRILHFSKDGKFIREWGHSSIDPNAQLNTYALGAFFLPHDVTLDEAGGRVYVADRQNGRVQAFTEKGDPLFEIRNLHYFVDVYSVHFCPEHGIFFIPGTTPDSEKAELNAFAVPLNSSKIQYAFRPLKEEFQKPHILRARKNSIWVGEISFTGGILWQFEIKKENSNEAPMNMFENSAVKGTEEESSYMSQGASMGPSVLLISLVFTLLVLVLYCVFKKWSDSSKSPQTLLDRKGFKPLRTMDVSDDESDTDLTVVSPTKN